MEIIFVLAFFLFVLFIGVSAIGIIIALIAAGLIFIFGSFFILALKLLPWLLLVLVIAWIIRFVNGKNRYKDKDIL